LFLEPAIISIIQIAKDTEFGRQIGREVLADAICDFLAMLPTPFIGRLHVQGNGSHLKFIH
jgi:hypothetical protein